MEAGLPVGGYVPKGRLAEDGRVPDKYPMIINIGPMKTGTALTARMAQELNKPLMVIQRPGFPDNRRYPMA
jgi:hypothetical protein